MLNTESNRIRTARGGSGYVIKPRLGTDLVVAILEVLAGRSFISPCLTLDDSI